MTWPMYRTMRRSGGSSNWLMEAIGPSHIVGRGLGLPAVHDRGIADDGVHGPAEDVAEHLRVGVAHGDDGVRGPGQAALVAPQELLPRTRQAGHAPGLAVDVVGVVDDETPEALAQRDRERQRDDGFRLPHVRGLDLLGDEACPGPRHEEVARGLCGATHRLAQPASHRAARPRPDLTSLRQAGHRQPGQRLRLAHAGDGVVVELLRGGEAGTPARDDGHVVAGPAQRHGRLPGAGIRLVGVVDEDGDARGGVSHRVPVLRHRQRGRLHGSAVRRRGTSVRRYHRPVPMAEAP